MTNEEINMMLKLLELNKLEELKYYLINEKYKNFSTNKQNAFEDYMCANGFDTTSILYEDKRNKRIIFSNGLSLYYLNNDKANINLKFAHDLIANSCVTICDFEQINKIRIKLLEERINELITKLVDINWSVYINNDITEFFVNNSVNPDEQIISDFKTTEIYAADTLLNKPNYKMDIKNPLLLAESEVGKAYILGKNKYGQITF